MALAAHGGDIYGAARRLGISPHEILDFSANINPLGLSPKARRRIQQDINAVCHYPDKHQDELRALVADKHRIDPNCIVFGNGATQLLYLLVRHLHPRSAVLPVPGFSENRAALRSVRSRVIEFRLRSDADFRVDMDALLAGLRKMKPNCVFITNPNNPTGSVVAPKDLLRAAHFCRKARIHLIVDESFIDFTEEPSLAAEAVRNPFLIVLRSLTKFYALPGLRIGYLTAHRSPATRLQQAIEPWSANTLALTAAAESMKDLTYQKRTRALVARERKYLEAHLQAFDSLQTYPSEANFLLARLKSKTVDGNALREALERNHILIRDARGFGGLGPQFIRIAVRTRSENRCLLQALKVISDRL